MSNLLWKPSEDQIKQSNMYRFMKIVNQKFNQNFNDYASLYDWSVENIANFWETMWEFADIIASKPYDQVIDDVAKMPGACWFSGSRVMAVFTVICSVTRLALSLYCSPRRCT